MAAATDSASHSLSPVSSSGFSGDGRRNLSSPTPWAHIVRGESEVVEAAPSSSPPVNSDFSPTADAKPASSPLPSDDSSSALEASEKDNSSVSGAKKPPAWNKPANDTIDVGPVMGAVSWPALSESTRALPKSLADTAKSLSTQQGPLIASSPNKQAQAITDANPNSTPNHAFPVRQKSIRRGSGGGPANSAFTQPPPSTVEVPRNNSANPGAAMATHSNKTQNWDGEQPRGGFAQRAHIANDHPHPRGSSFRRGNGGPHPRGDGSYPNNYTGRHEHDRANHEWNPQRNFNGRDVHLQQHHRIFPRNLMRHPATGPFISPPPPPPPPPPVRPFGNQIGFHDMMAPVYYVPHEPLRGVPFIHPTPPPMFFPAPDPQLCALLLRQIDYYFSPDNLCKDIFLRQKMDGQGWVPVSLIANFNRVRQLTNNTQIILDAVRTSTVVEVKGDKMRRRNDWITWLLPPSNRSTSVSAPQSSHIPNTDDMLANHVQNVKLEGNTTNDNATSPANPLKGAVTSSSSSQELNGQPQTPNMEGTGQGVAQAGSYQSMLTRSSNEN